MLNEYKNEIIAVRATARLKLDQMVLEFPVMADYAILVLNGLAFFAAHGHLFNQDQMPVVKGRKIFWYMVIHIF